jgi:Rrf2 family nitric oxide-sensitive transcriptional repressor
MKLTAFTDYSLRVLIYLAARPERRGTISEIAEAFDVSENHLVKVVHFLAKAGWLTSIRGKGGGLELSRPAGEIGIGKVVRETEGEAVLANCFTPGGGDCAIRDCCHLKCVLDEAMEAFYGVLDRHTLADVASNRGELSRVLFIGREAAA